MIERLHARPRTIGSWSADAVRVLGVLSVPVTLIGWTPFHAGTLALAVPVLLLPRLVGVRWWFDAAFCVAVLSASWSNTLDLYGRIAWWDLMIHTVCAGVFAGMLYLLLARLAMVAEPPGTGRARWSATVLTAAIGLAVSALWEMFEWFAHTFVSSEIFVGYEDSISDMALGGVGSMAAGLLVASVPLLCPRARPSVG